MKNKKTSCIALIIMLAALALPAKLANAEKYFALDINNIQGSIVFNSISLRELDRTIKYPDKSGFLIKTNSFDGSETQKIYFNLSDTKNYILYVPYDKNTAKILVYNQAGSVVMDVDTSSFADTCGNKICEPYESYENCQQDCKSGSRDGFCDGTNDGICDPDCPARLDTDCKGNLNNQTSLSPNDAQKTNGGQMSQIIPDEPVQGHSYIMWLLFAAAIIAAASIFFLIKKIKENKVVNSLREYIGDNIRKGFTLSQIKDTLFRAGYKENEINKAIKSI